jgi:hypothetical protein
MITIQCYEPWPSEPWDAFEWTESQSICVTLLKRRSRCAHLPAGEAVGKPGPHVQMQQQCLIPCEAPDLVCQSRMNL